MKRAILILALSLTGLSASAQSVNFFGNTVPMSTGCADTSVEIGLRFQTSVPGFITGVRFFKKSQNIGTHIGNLWSSGGTLLASVTFTGESASGWQQANFNAPIPISVNTAYIISYSTTTGYYALDQNYFTNSSYPNSQKAAD